MYSVLMPPPDLWVLGGFIISHRTMGAPPGVDNSCSNASQCVPHPPATIGRDQITRHG